ncbi:hypothetical protein CGRA01v4_12056 [Colletotrichum graminicola]|nr:hypothetical protein CGRA01v4_12056 [Colletotrichum graminicola]
MKRRVSDFCKVRMKRREECVVGGEKEEGGRLNETKWTRRKLLTHFKNNLQISPGWGSMGVSKGLHRTEQDRRCKEHGRRQAGQGAWKTKVRTIGWREAADRYVPSRGWQAMYLPKARYKYFPRPGRGVRWEVR